MLYINIILERIQRKNANLIQNEYKPDSNLNQNNNTTQQIIQETVPIILTTPMQIPELNQILSPTLNNMFEMTIILNDEYAGLSLMYSAIQGEEDKKTMPNPADEEQMIADFDELFNDK